MLTKKHSGGKPRSEPIHPPAACTVVEGVKVAFVYEYMWENTVKVLLDGNRMVHTRNVTYDIADYGQDKVLGPPSDKPDKVDLDRDFHEMLRDIVPGGIKTSKPPEDQTPASVKDDEQRGDSLRGDSQPQDYDPGSPAIGTPDFSEDHYGGVEVDLTQQPNIP